MSALCISELSARERTVDVLSLHSVRRKRLERFAKDTTSGLNGVIAKHIIDEALAFFDEHSNNQNAEEEARQIAREKAHTQRARYRVHPWRGNEPEIA